jgi:hypothetical protein
VEEEAERRGELVPDHALAAEEADLFDHEDYVVRLVEVVEEASPRHAAANIALYGPWGSGKSSIANLFAAKLEAAAEERRAEGKEPRFVFLSFDAFKYARRPFLRQFIRQLSSQVLPPKRARHYQRRLYQERTHLEARFAFNWWAVTAALVAVVASFAALLIFLPHGHARDIVIDVVHVAAIVVVPSALLLGVIGQALPILSASATSGPPESDEQFETLFNEILAELGIDATSEQKLVVFVDELDRCSPAEVAQTLETLRTFLGVPGCIFIVGADQRVLEQALCEHVRQATPPDPANPYYSEGSAYLDKIFQYQLALSPFRVPRLVGFALALVEGREGIWTEVDLDEVLPILLPTHIDSPRRVKVLLNAFALTYGVAKRRDLGGTLRGRASELAKLVCLRVEFPLFAADLAIDDRLTAAVLAAAIEIEAGRDPAASAELAALPIEIRRRAVGFARGDLLAAQLLSEDPDRHGLDSTLLDYDSSAAEAEDEGEEADRIAAEDDGSVGEGEEGRDVAETGRGRADAAPVRHVQALQLVRYLDKTATVQGPGNDLIHLEAAGATFGLDAQIAQQLERDALDGREGAVARAIEELPEDGRESALRMLGQRAHSSHGLDGRNVMRCLLAAAAASRVSTEQVAAVLAPDLEVFARRNRFAEGDAAGALAIAVFAGRPKLIADVLEADEDLENEALRRQIVALAAPLLKDHEPIVLEAMATQLRGDGGAAAAQAAALDPETAESVWGGATAILAREVVRRRETIESDAAEPSAASERAMQIVEARVAELGAAARALPAGARPLAEIALSRLLAWPSRLVGAEVDSTLEALGRVEGAEAAASLYAYALRQELPASATLLAAIDPAALVRAEGSPDPLLAHLWERTEGGLRECPEELWEQVWRLFGKRRKAQTSPAARAEVVGGLQRRIDTGAAAVEYETRLAFAGDLVRAGLLGAGDLAGALAETIAATVEPPIGLEEPEVLGHLRAWIGQIAVAGTGQLHHAHGALGSAECWVPSPGRERMDLEVAAFLRRRRQPVRTLDLAAIVALTEEHGSEAVPALAIWIANFPEDPEDVATAVEGLAASPPAAIREALSDWSRPRGRALRTRLALPLIESAFGLRTSPALLRAARADVAEEGPLVKALCDLAAHASNPTDRRRVLDLWEAVSPRSEDSWRALAEEVMLRFAAEGATPFDLVRSRLSLARGMPPGARGLLVRGLEAAVPKGDGRRAKQLSRALAEARLTEAARKIGGVSVPFSGRRPRRS